jgi:hypothetical protein
MLCDTFVLLSQPPTPPTHFLFHTIATRCPIPLPFFWGGDGKSGGIFKRGRKNKIVESMGGESVSRPLHL